MNPLIKEAELLQSPSGWQPSGYVEFKVKIEKSGIEGDFVVIHLGFWGLKELSCLLTFAKERNWQAYKAGDNGVADASNGHIQNSATPICPIHGETMQPSKKPNSYYCPKRQGGGFCKHTANLQPSGIYLVK